MEAWKKRHEEALLHPHDAEAALVEMLRGWKHYAEVYADRFDDSIGNDYFLGPLWAQIGVQLRGLLNGETGRLDCGTLDGLILGLLEAQGFDEEGEQA